MREQAELDSVDWHILEELQNDATLANRTLAEIVGLAGLLRTPEVVECRRITGEDCYVLLAHVRDVLHLEEVIDRFAVLGQTTTSIVQSSPVPPRGLRIS